MPTLELSSLKLAETHNNDPNALASHALKASVIKELPSLMASATDILSFLSGSIPAKYS